MSIDSRGANKNYTHLNKCWSVVWSVWRCTEGVWCVVSIVPSFVPSVVLSVVWNVVASCGVLCVVCTCGVSRGSVVRERSAERCCGALCKRRVERGAECCCRASCGAVRRVQLMFL